MMSKLESPRSGNNPNNECEILEQFCRNSFEVENISEHLKELSFRKTMNKTSTEVVNEEQQYVQDKPQNRQRQIVFEMKNESSKQPALATTDESSIRQIRLRESLYPDKRTDPKRQSHRNNSVRRSKSFTDNRNDGNQNHAISQDSPITIENEKEEHTNQNDKKTQRSPNVKANKQMARS